MCRTDYSLSCQLKLKEKKMKLCETWLYWRDQTHSPYFNMAADELLLSLMPVLQQPILRTYTWNCKSVSIGFSQRWGITPEDYVCVRRPTGGGVVFHDVDLTYTLVFPIQHPLASCSREKSYEIIHKALVDQFKTQGIHAGLLPVGVDIADHSMMQCFISPSKFDVMDGDEKSAGAAQRRTRDGVLHQGSIKLSVTHGNVEKLIENTLQAFALAFDVTYTDWEPDAQFMETSEVLGQEKYASERWSLKRRYP